MNITSCKVDMFKNIQRHSHARIKCTISPESQPTHTHTHNPDWQLVMAQQMHLRSQGWQNDHADMITSDRTIARGDELSSERFVQPSTRHNSQLKSDAHTEQETRVRWRSSALVSPAPVQVQTDVGGYRHTDGLQLRTQKVRRVSQCGSKSGWLDEGMGLSKRSQSLLGGSLRVTEHVLSSCPLARHWTCYSSLLGLKEACARRIMWYLHFSLSQ